MTYNATAHQAGNMRKNLCTAFTLATSSPVSQRQARSVLAPDSDGTSIRNTYIRAKLQSYLSGKYANTFTQD